MQTATLQSPAWSDLLANAVSQPGRIAEAYSRFWNYSAGNQLLALFQCATRGIQPGPIHTFVGWKDLGRYVRKGEKAITLCMPITCKRKAANSEATGQAEAEADTFTRFVYRPHWFVLSQTDGAEYHADPVPGWDEATALAALNITRVPFDMINGNVQGYAVSRKVAVSPVAFAPARTLIHELAHVLLGHTGEAGTLADDERTPRNLAEVEAESVALICCESLGLGGAEYSRGYIQHWINTDGIPERSAQRIFKAADQVLRAGRPTAE